MRCYQAQPIGRERFLLVLRLDAAAFGKNPDLQQMDGIAARWIDFAVQHARSRAHALHFARTDDGSRPHVVAMFELTFEDVSNDFHIAVAMCSKTATGRYSVLVDHTQRAETHELGVIIVSEREGMIGIQPAMVEVASLVCLPNSNHMKVASVTTNKREFR